MNTLVVVALILVAAICALGAVACEGRLTISSQPIEQSQVREVENPPSPIRVTEVKSPAPEFERIYDAELPGGFRIHVPMKTFIRRRSDYGSTLTQPGGKYIIFDAHAVADKIIDRDLAPKVQALVDEMLRMDREFMDAVPRRYTDENGHVWVREN